ncbi:MAG: protein kinase domain-containing protein, partial [Actinomycetota bacterium]
ANVFDYGEDEHYFIVMEFIEGRDLAQVMAADGAMSPARAARIGTQVCDALAHAHAASVIHRDIKPANILMSADDRVKVTDFGIARAAGDSTLTAAGSVLGTAHYLSPEQASGDPVGPASDQYSVGVVLYEMLTGAVPYSGDSPVVIAMRHVSEEMPPPSAVNPDVPPALDAAVQRATTKNPAERFEDAAALGTALRAAVDEASPVPIPAAPVAAAGPARRDRKTNKGPTSLLTPPDGTGTGTGAGGRFAPDRLDPRRVGRAVILFFAALVAVVLILLLIRLATADEEEPAGSQRRPAQDSAATDESSPQEAAPEMVQIPSDLVGDEADEAAAELSGLGLDVLSEDSSSEDYDEGLVIASNPAPGADVQVGSTVTLTVSAGEEDVAEDDDDERGPPDHAGQPGKPPKQPKDKDEDDDD